MQPHRIKMPGFIQSAINKKHIDISISRVLPFICLLVFGALVGIVFNTGIQHPYDKIIHVTFYALLTLSIHTLFCCRLRISALLTLTLGFIGEGAQYFMPNHEASMADAIANGIGVAMVVAGIALIRSEEKQSLKSEPIDFGLKLDHLGLEPVKQNHKSSSEEDR